MTGDFQATMDEKIVHRDGRNGCVEMLQRLVIRLPEGKQPGQYAGEIGLKWSDGIAFSHPMRWEVEPELKISPAALVLKEDQSVATLTIIRKLKGVHINKVSGNQLEDYTITDGARNETTKIVVQLKKQGLRERGYIDIEAVNGRVDRYRIPILRLPN